MTNCQSTISVPVSQFLTTIQRNHLHSMHAITLNLYVNILYFNIYVYFHFNHMIRLVHQR